MERRLQERCAELQREVFRLQGAQSESCKSIDKRPVALPRHVPPTNKQTSSEHEDEGISSSETGQSLSPVPILVFPRRTEKFNVVLNDDKDFKSTHKDDDAGLDADRELENIVNNSEKQISVNISSSEQNLIYKETKEEEIVPVNLLPQPPRKSKSLAHLISHNGGSDLDASEYGLLLIHNNSHTSLFDDLDYEIDGGINSTGNVINNNHHHHHDTPQNESNLELSNSSMHPSTNREILDVIMKSKEIENDPTMNALRANSVEQRPTSSSKTPSVPPPPPPPQHFNGVFFMTEMNSPQKYPKPDVAAALQARRVSKNLERIESYGLDSMVDIVLTSSDKLINNRQICFGSSPTLKIPSGYNESFNHISNFGILKHSTRTRSHVGSKVTDNPSGLY